MSADKATVFCYECLEDVYFVAQREERIGTLKGGKYPYMRMVARCPHCNEELDVYNDENLSILYDAYREVHNLISLEKIREIPVLYGIGKRVLSSLLGWGEITFTRYYDGYLPTKQYSDVLKKLYDDPSYYRAVLEDGKHAINEVAYSKSVLALQKLLTADPTPIMKVAGYLHQKKTDLTSFRLQKLLYYNQGISGAFNPEPLFHDLCQAWVAGPVYRDMFYKFKNNSIDPTLGDLLSADERETIDSVLDCFGRYDGDTLVLFTHNETPWIEARGDLPPDAHSDKIIPIESIVKYFSKVKDEYGMASITDMKQYVQDMLRRI